MAWCGDVIRRQSETMALLLDDLLEISRITSGKLELKKAYVELRETVESALEAARPLIDGRGHTLDVEWPEAPIQLEADPLRVTQILTNLLTNAAKYTEAGGRIALRARHDAEHAVLEVQDNGIGIAAEQLPRVFEMFHQLEGALGRAEGGLGIGLALAKGLAEMHGGTLQAMSAGAGHGATFRLRLPLGNPPSSKQVEAIASGAHTCTSRKRRVLIADDNRDAAVLFGALLEIEGYDVDLAYDGTQALEAVFQDRHDAAFLDIGMPGLNGYELAARIRSEAWGSKLLLIATTGWGRDDDKRRALVAGFDVHLTKPLVPDAATRLLAERLGGAGA